MRLTCHELIMITAIIAITLVTLGDITYGQDATAATSNAAPVRSTMPEIVITASRSPRDIQSEPSTTYYLSAPDSMVSDAIRTTPDALKGIPSTMVQKTGYGQGSPYLRGFTGFRTLCLINGIRLNNSVFRDGPNQYWNTVDPFSIGAYELVMGPSSVLYGSDAIGGLLNAIPAEPPEYDGSALWEPRLLYRGATADKSTSGRIQLGGRVSEELGFIGGVSLKNFGDLRGGKDVGLQEHTGYTEQDYDARLDYYINKISSLTLGFQSVNQDDAWRTHRTIYGIDWQGLSVGDDKIHTYDQHRDLTYLKYHAESLNSLVDGIDLTVSRQGQKEDMYRVRKDDKSDVQGFDVTTWGVSLQLDSDSKIGNWVYGAEYYRDGVNSYSQKYKADGSLDKIEIQGPVADDASYDNAGLFIQDTLSFLDGKLDVIPGARYTYASANASKVKDPITGKATALGDDWSAFAGSLRILHPLTADRRHVIYAGVSQGFRAPNLSDLTRLDIARSGEIETPAPGLEPEQYVAYEIGFKSRTERFTSQLSFYHTTVDKMIVRTPTGRMIDESAEVTKKNSGQGYIQGAEVSGHYRWTPQLSSWASATWMDGKVDAYPTSESEKARDYISRLMPPTLQVGARWQTSNSKYWTELVGDMAAKADRLSAEDLRDTQRVPPGGTPAYAVCTVRAGARIMKDMNVVLAVENVLDDDYRIHGSGVNEPGRN
ncbi:MAG: TonB-dependent receptor, partial [bacterium]